jgi:hypothetical protein
MALDTINDPPKSGVKQEEDNDTFSATKFSDAWIKLKNC